jgi:alpha-ketoglutarate-dependent taurine dioxygenase
MTATIRSRKFELTFWGSTPKRYRRWHTSLASARDTAEKILDEMDNRAAHPAIIYGPDCGRDGLTIN